MSGTPVRPVDRPVAASLTAVQAFPLTNDLTSWSVYNDTAGDLYLKFVDADDLADNPAVALSVATTSFHVKVPTGGYYELVDVFRVAGRVEAVGSVGTGTWRFCLFLGA